MADYSGWERVDNNSANQGQPSLSTGQYSGWQVVQPIANSMQAPVPQEGFGMAALKAVPRIGEDVYRGLFNTVKQIPQYYDTLKEGLPAAMEEIKNHPVESGKQAIAGLAELGQNVFNTPHDLINYTSTRLNLIPSDINQKVQMARMPSNTEDAINQTFGAPQNKGDEFLRAVSRNSLGAIGAAALARQ